MARHAVLLTTRRTALLPGSGRGGRDNPGGRVRLAGRDGSPGNDGSRGPEGALFKTAAVLFVLLAVALGGWLHASGRWPFEPDAGPPPVLATPPPALGAPVVRVGAATALAVLETLPVKGRAARTNYDRSAFGEAWLDADFNGCDTRNDILRRDLQDTTFEKGSLCQVRTGTFHEPYTGQTVTFQRGATTSAAVQIDHLVALGNAWQTGAQQLTAVQRQSLANDPLNLLAVDGPANVEKSDADAATWLPPEKKFRCQYVARQISVKAAYRLWVTPAEKAAMARVLGPCPAMKVLASGYGS
ncbi:HNH endonuclease [Arthrobacter livingstonensis]|uniref:HNH endonuclease n=1 Tax=Arthrobacter livingstonensis TaxID=670078 RepID=A0A2V5LI28_9MICC|nr:HNH endonuclease family protein [Arthrobacter livingstonensis]PYI66460.1 HNH endonuclease [Arthrobacter livingstonensis]